MFVMISEVVEKLNGMKWVDVVAYIVMHPHIYDK